MKTLYISLLIFSVNSVFSQLDLYSKLNAFITNQTNEKTEKRLIAVNVWTFDNEQSRKANTEFEETYRAFEYAKLKGGYKGIIVLHVNLDKDNVSADITLQKDGISKMIKVPADNSDIIKSFQGKPSGYNIVFDQHGKVIYENLKPGEIITSVQKLITR